MVMPQLSKRLTITLSVVMLSLILIGLLALYNSRNKRQPKNYEECVQQGGTVMESYPPQCRDTNGNTFTMSIDSQEDKGTTIPFSVVATGTNTVTKFDDQMATISTQEDWKKLWENVKGKEDALPQIDFAKKSVVALFMGDQPTGGYSLEVSKVTESDRFIVYVTVKSPGLGCMTTQSLTSPYTLITFDGNNKPVIYRTEQKIINCLG
jgi:hypothetical protein